MADIDELSGKHELSTSVKVRARLDSVKTAKLKEAKRLSDLIGAGQGKDSNPDIDLQPSDNELYMRVRTVTVNMMICLCPARLSILLLS